MASDNVTAANVLSSLHVRGASVTGGDDRWGFLPILDSSGLLDPSTIPLEAISGLLTVPALKRTAFVDPGRTDIYIPDGSIAYPYKSLSSAASNAQFDNFVLAAGDYGTDNVVIASNSSEIHIFSSGAAYSSGNSLTFSGYHANVHFVFENVSISGTLTLASTISSTVTLLGNGSTTSLTGRLGDDSDSISTRYMTVEIGSGYAVGSISNAVEVRYLSKSSQILNSSLGVPGYTVKDAMDGIGSRRIRVPLFSADSDGIHMDDNSDIEVDLGSSSDDYALYDIRALGTSISLACNAVFHKDGDSPEYNEVSAVKMTSETVETTELTTSELKFGNRAEISVNNDGFLEIS